jgi:hypothetical protein
MAGILRAGRVEEADAAAASNPLLR